MKNSKDPLGNCAIREDFQRLSHSFYGNSPILIISDIDHAKLEYINPMVDLYCGVEAENILNGNRCFYREIIHPDDYRDYFSHLNNLKRGEEKEITIRLRVRDEKWSKFCFKDRYYSYDPNKTGSRIILSLAYKLTEETPGPKEELSCEDMPTIPAPGPYEELLNSIDEAYCIIELIFNKEMQPVDYLFLETNPAFEKQVKLKNVNGITMRELIPNHEEHWFTRYGKVAITGEPMRFQEYSEQLGQDWFDIYAFKIDGENSRRVAVLFHNITQRKIEEENLKKTQKALEERAKQRQEELDENTGLLQTVFDSSNLAIAVLKTLYDPKGNIKDFLFVRVNKVLSDLYHDRDVLGKTYVETSEHGVMLGLMDDFKEVMKTGTPKERELFLDKKGYNNWFRITARNQKHLLIVAIEDITARKAESEKLKDAIRFKRQLVQTSPDTILIMNLSTKKVRYINQDMLKRAGMTRKRIAGMSLPEILSYTHPRDREALMNFQKKIIKSSEHEIFDIEFRLKTEGSDWEWFSARGKIFNRRDKNWVEEYVLLVRNITQQKTTQRALLNAERLSIQGEIARTFAHELRNPLASIRMATDVIKHKLESPQKELLGNYFDILSRSTKVLNNLVTNLLNASNYSPAVLEKVDLADCLNETIDLAADRIYLTGIKIIKLYKGPYYILADKDKLKIALLNIIVNASEATSPDNAIIKLSIKKFKSDFMLSISDNGHGLEKEQIDRLFDAFYTNKATGAGIGLNSVKNILEEHDAKIKVKSTPNVGTTFSIYFQNINYN